MRSLIAACLLSIGFTTAAADYPAPKEGDWVLRNFRLHTGEVMPEVRLHYTTIGDPKNDAVVVLHGTGGSARSMLTPAFAGELFGAGQPLDATRYFIVIPDALGHGKSSKPSDGLRMKFPHYNYDDMVESRHRLLTEGLGIKHVRLVIGNSMGGMETWLWAGRYPGYMDIAVPMASMPSPMGSRNWMMRRLIIDAIRNDPDWKNGEYTTQPKGAQFGTVYYQIATNGGNWGHYKAAPTREKADALLAQRLAAPFTADANDLLYQWESSRDYDPSAVLDRITSTLVAINAADDERNPVEIGVMQREIQRVKNGRLHIIPADGTTTGHGTTGNASFYRAELETLLRTAPRLGP